jgi:hypothetical protein
MKNKQYSGRPKGLSSKYKELFYIGAKFGKWEIIDDDIIYFQSQNSNFRKGKIKVKCECGFEKIVDLYSLKEGSSRGCYDCSHKKTGHEHPLFKGYKEIPLRWYNRYVNRNQEVNMDIKDVYNLWLKQDKKCALSDLSISFENEQPLIKLNPMDPNYGKNGKKTKHNYTCTASLDRIDSSKGYILGNIQLVHRDVNRMKSDFEQDYFIKICKLISLKNE